MRRIVCHAGGRFLKARRAVPAVALGIGLGGLLCCSEPTGAERAAGGPGETRLGAGEGAVPSEEGRVERAFSPPTSLPGAAIRYRVSFQNRENQYFHVEAQFPTEGAEQLELMLPAWTPGSYLIREYSGLVEALRVEGGGPVVKLSKNRYRVDTQGEPEVKLHYDLYAGKASVRDNWVSGDRAVVIGAATFITRADALQRPHEVRLAAPGAWSTSITGLTPASNAPHHYRARNYDQLVDCPIVVGNPDVHSFEVQGVSHRLANFGAGEAWDGPASAWAVERIARAVVEFWGARPPYEHYSFINWVGPGRGGLEHANSTLMATSRWATGTRSGFTDWMGLVSHEFFHTWNVKRLRPISLGPFDYDRENYSRSLWIVEGLTSYYDDLLLVRAGLITRKEYLGRLSDTLSRVESRPGRHVQSLEMASFDAWVKAYRPHANSKNATVNYYARGSLVGFLLDARLRQSTQGRRSLDDAMHVAYERYSGGAGYRPDQFQSIVEQIAGQPLSEFFERFVRGTQPLDYAPAWAWYGLRLDKPAGAPPRSPGSKASAGAEPASSGGKAASEVDALNVARAPRDLPAAYLGLESSVVAGRLVASSVERGSPAWDAGLQPQDELIALEGYRLSGDLAARLQHYRPGQKVEFLLARRGEVLRRRVELGPPEPERVLSLASEPSAQQKAALDAWLGRAEPLYFERESAPDR